MGIIFSVAKNLFKLGLIFLGTFFLAGIADLILSFAPLSSEAHRFTFLLATACFVVALFVLVYGHSVRGMKWPMLIAFGSVATVLIGYVIIAITLKSTQYSSIIVVNIIIVAIILLYTDTEFFRSLDLKDCQYVAAIEVTEIPLNYIENQDQKEHTSQDDDSPTRVFHNLLTRLTYSDTPVCLRITRFENKTRIFFLTWAPSPEELTTQQNELHQSLSTYLSKFKIQLLPNPPEPPITPIKAAIAHLSGEPHEDPSGKGNTTLGESILSTSPSINTIYQVFATPQRVGILDRWFTRRRYESKEKDSRETITVDKRQKKQKSYTRVDAKALAEAERVERRLKRLRSHRVLAVRVTATCWQPTESNSSNPVPEITDERLKNAVQGHLEILASTMQSADPAKILKVDLLSNWAGRPFIRLFRGRPTGKVTLLTHDETAPYFAIPHCDLGIPVTDKQAFLTPTGTSKASSSSTRPHGTSKPSIEVGQEEIVSIGQLLRNGRLIDQELTILINRLCLHIGLYGNTGSGKTNTGLLLVHQIHQHKIPFLVIVPAKTEWRQLRHLIPDLLIFTAGDEHTAPFRFNFFDVPPGVPLHTHIENITTCFIANWPTEGILTEHISKIFRRTYTNAGWDPLTDKRGSPILLTDLHTAMQQVTDELQYGAELKQDFIGALKARIESLLDNPILAVMFNTTKGLTIPELLNHPIILELRGLPDTQKALLTSLISVGIAEYLEAQHATQTQTKSGLRHLLVLEEAHHLLKRVNNGYGLYAGHAAQQQAIDTIIGLLREARAFELGIVLIDQLPGSLAEAAVKLPGITIIHTLRDQEERTLVGRQANLTDDQLRHVGTMDCGEAIIHTSFTSQAVNVQVNSFQPLLPKNAKQWTNERVAKAMQAFYNAHPNLHTQNLPKLPKPNKTTPPPATPFVSPETHWEPNTAIVRQLIYHTGSPQFQKGYLRRLELAANDDAISAVTFIINLVKKFVKDPEEIRPYCSLLFRHIAQTIHKECHIHLFDKLLFSLHDQLDSKEATPIAP